jgi:GDPmannose 4,6-dehydratase
MMKRALITGVLGQDGTYLAEHLLGLGYRVYGLCRRSPDTSSWVRNWLYKQGNHQGLEFVYGDMRDEMSVRNAFQKAWPDEVYNFAGQVFVPVSWQDPETTFDVNVGGLLRILKCAEGMKKDTRIYQASSSEMYGNHEGACDDQTPLNPTSPYGISKMASHRLAGLYRQRGMFVTCGMLFNHESPRRGQEMVTRKIAGHVASWAAGFSAPLRLGNMDSRRDWGFAGEYVKAMHLMLQQDKSDDYVVGTGESYSVGQFLQKACEIAGVSKEFCDDHTEVDSRLTRTQEIYDMRANNEKIRRLLGWEPMIKFEQLVELMVNAELKILNVRKAAYAS